MRFSLPICTILLAWGAAAHAQGLLVPQDESQAPLTLVKHRVTVAIEDQVATTEVEQTFLNPTDRALEATYLFPVPKGASVNHFDMWVDGQKVSGELLKASEAKQTYTDIVRRAQDPGLLEYLDSNLMRMRVFPVPAHAKQKVMVSFTCVAAQDGDTVEYVCPLRADSKTAQSLEEFSLTATIRSQHGVQNVYSPSHAVHVDRINDREVKVGFEKGHAALDRDFRLFYALGDKDVGLTALTCRPVSDEDGHFLLLLSPRLELAESHVIPRDLVLVLDTSGSMQGVKMEQARKALKHCLGQLRPQDRFAVLNFATVVNHYREHLVEASHEQIGNARKWVDKLEANGSTAINDALLAALALRSKDAGRTFTVVFFTDGCPTVGECDCDKIVKNVLARNTANTRIFTFGVGDDVNATLLDQLAEQTRAVSTFVRPAEDIEEKASNLYAKISHPVLTDLKLTVGSGIHVTEVYPPKLPDLFHGGQVIVSGRYTGHGPATVTLTGNVGKKTKEFVYETTFPKKTGDDKAFVEQLWARRKVGYLLDQIRAHGEKKELVDEVTSLAKKHGIATPYTSYLIAPDRAAPLASQSAPVPVAPVYAPARPTIRGSAPAAPTAATPMMPGYAVSMGASAMPPTASPAPAPSAAFWDADTMGTGTGYANHGVSRTALPPVGAGGANASAAFAFENPSLSPGTGQHAISDADGSVLTAIAGQQAASEAARQALAHGDRDGYQTGAVGVELALQLKALQSGDRPEQRGARTVGKRTCLNINGVWIDDGFDTKMPTIAIKALSAAYFRILERHPEMKEVFQLGNRLVWVTPSGTALVVDPGNGKDKLTDEEIDGLFAAKK
jgi:Ca-activated chloride channel family protein